jgi:carboxymethylenebutenolidase
MPEEISTFQSQGHPIKVEIFRRGEGLQPAVLLLHGANGLQHEGHRRVAETFADRGFTVLFVHYFDRTGTLVASRNDARNNFLLWHKVILDGVAFAQTQPAILADRIGIYGLSLGGTLAVSVAGHLPEICAIVLHGGEVPEPGLQLLKALPPTLILHGDADRIVPVANALRLEHWLKERNIPVETRIYEGEGHFFREEAFADATRMAISFFERQLRPERLEQIQVIEVVDENKRPDQGIPT